ncbi:MAG: Chaperone protein DnaJ [Candidatus Methanogaster sp.]|nr:MAG: Chaperone protein DnaJ [ANME-2 cluster archaeon]
MKSERRKFGITLLFAVVFTTLAFVSVGCASGIPPEEAWNKTFGGTDPDGASSVQQTSDGGYILAGHTYSYGAGSSDFWLVKTYSDGSKQGDKTFGGTHYDCIFSAQQTSDDGYILAGVTESYGAGSGDLWLVKADSEGNEQWNRTFGGIDPDWAVSVQQTSDGGYIFAGDTMSHDTGSGDFWLVKTDSKGNKEWDKTFGGVDACRAPSVQQTSDGGYILAGCMISHGAGPGDLWLVKTDSKGNKEWDRTFGGVNVHRAHYPVQQTSDGGYILAGVAESYGTGNSDAWLLKVGGTDSAPPTAEATELAATSTPVQTHTPEQNDKPTQMITVSLQSGVVLAIGVMLFGVVFIFFIAYVIRRNYKSKIEDKTRLVIGIIVSFISDVCLLLIIFHYGTIEPFISDLSNINPVAIGIMAIVYGMHVVVWMWTFIGLKSKYLRAITGYFLFLSSVFCLNRLVFLIAMKISLDTLFLSGAMMASGILFCAVFGLIPFFLLLIGEYIADKTGFIKRTGKYLNYLYKEKVIWGTNTKKNNEKRRESPNHDERKHKTHKKSAGSAKDDTRPYYYKVLDVSTDASRDEIKKAYRRLSMLYHPDTSTDPDAEQKMKEINKAHDVLSDPDKRARYDNFENSFKG